MKLVTRSAWINAPADTIWQRVAALDWDRWDPDLDLIEGATQGFVEGGPAVFSMKNGRRFKAHFHALDAPRHAEWTASGLGGLLSARGIMDFEPGVDGTRFTYQFGMGGPVGSVLMRVMSDHVNHAIQGCVDGLARVMAEQMAAEALDRPSESEDLSEAR